MPLTTVLGEALSTKKDYLAALKEMELHTVEDLLLYFPRSYEDLSEVKKLHQVQPGEIVTLKGVLSELKRVPTRKRGFSLIKAQFHDDFGNLAELVWFNQPHLLQMLPQDTPVMVAGRAELEYGQFKFQNPKVEAAGGAQIHTAGLIPVYPEHGIITSAWLRNKIHPLLELAGEFEEALPGEILREENLMSKAEAMREVHFPTSQKSLGRARDRLAYEELFFLQLNAVQSKAEWRKNRAGEERQTFKMDVDFVKKFFGSLPFQPTGAQKVAIFEILSDMEKPYPMMRLLEGDVGSGKTLVAVTAMLHAIKQGHQVALMAPTEVLARQHLLSISRLLTNFEQGQAEVLPSSKRGLSEDPARGPMNIGPSRGGRVPQQEKAIPLPAPFTNIQLLIGSLPVKDKKAILDGIKNGQVDIVVGTHALIQEGVEFNRLGLVVVDEQHRFGVKQREFLMRQGSPHVLNMTATPIPRTLAIVAYGDQDLSVLNEMPPGRQPIITKVAPPEHRQTVYRFIEGKMRQGEQVYVICPLIDESDALEIKSVKTEFERLKNIFLDFKVAMLHGRLKSEEKEQIMRDFKDKKIHLLVSTSVIEVGIDVPNATIMLIEGADRFGLSQLHQFRGRVGRGSAQSYCFLFSDSLSDNTFTRLKAMVDHHDGFKLAEIDLQLRGPGEVYGLRQSGLPDLKIASLSNGVLVSRVRKAAEHLVEHSPTLQAYPRLQSILIKLRNKLNTSTAVLNF